jgi:hypothetical protein
MKTLARALVGAVILGALGGAASASLIGTDITVSVTGETIDGPLVIFPSLTSDAGFATSLTHTAAARPDFDLGSQPSVIVVDRTYRVDIQGSAILFESWSDRSLLN